MWFWIWNWGNSPSLSQVSHPAGPCPWSWRVWWWWGWWWGCYCGRFGQRARQMLHMSALTFVPSRDALGKLQFLVGTGAAGAAKPVRWVKLPRNDWLPGWRRPDSNSTGPVVCGASPLCPALCNSLGGLQFCSYFFKWILLSYLISVNKNKFKTIFKILFMALNF